MRTKRFDAYVYVHGRLDYSSHGIDAKDRDLIVSHAREGGSFVVVRYHQGATAVTARDPVHDVDDQCVYCDAPKKMHTPCPC